MCHTICFGLPEDPKHIRALLSHSTKSGLHVDRLLSKSKETPHPDLLMLDDSNHITRYLSIRPKKSDDTDDAPTDDLIQICILVQDSDGNIRMYDSRRSELMGLGIEVKILNNGKFILGEQLVLFLLALACQSLLWKKGMTKTVVRVGFSASTRVPVWSRRFLVAFYPTELA
ncbi:unnamed protein product [Aphanomyces euteiches]